MTLPQIINSLLENDMYKFSMGQCIYHQFSAYKTTWTFKCRNTDVFFYNGDGGRDQGADPGLL